MITLDKDKKYTQANLQQIITDKDYFYIQSEPVVNFENFDVSTEKDGVFCFSGIKDKEQIPSIFFFEVGKWKLLDAIMYLKNMAANVTKDSINHASAEEVERVFDENRTFIICEASIKEDVDKEKLAKAAKLESVDPDLLPVSFKLVHANQNKNKDIFDAKDLELAKNTPKLKPLNWQHVEPIIGVMYDSDYIEASEKEDAHLLVDSVVYKYRYPEYANEIIDRHNNDTLRFSMEVWFKEAECSVCGHTASKQDDYCEHLKNRYIPGSTSARILRGIVFGGAGVVDNPADVQAESVSLGENHSKEDIMPKNTEGKIVFDTQAELDSFIKEKIDEVSKAEEKDEMIENLNTEITNLKTELENVSKELETEKANIVKLTEEKEVIEKEFASFKENLEKEKTLEARIVELVDAGVVIPESTKEKFHESVKEMSEEAYTMYKELLVASIKEKANNTEEENDTPPVDVPNSSNASNNKPFSTLRTILDKTGASVNTSN